MCVYLHIYIFLISYVNYQSIYIFSICSIISIVILDLYNFLLRQSKKGLPWKKVIGVMGSSLAWAGLEKKKWYYMFFWESGYFYDFWKYTVPTFYHIIKSWWLMKVQTYFHCTAFWVTIIWNLRLSQAPSFI